jgi:hypothetical protein
MNLMTRVAAYGLLVLGLLQMLGSLTGVAGLRDIGAASAASPAPQVFTTTRGLETFSTRFELSWYDADGMERSMVLTPDLYSGLRGPSNRRSVYGAVLAYGPLLATDPRTAEMYQQVSRFALCGDAPVLRDLGLDPRRIGPPITLSYTPRPGSDIGDLPRSLTVSCR